MCRAWQPRLVRDLLGRRVEPSHMHKWMTSVTSLRHALDLNDPQSCDGFMLGEIRPGLPRLLGSDARRLREDWIHWRQRLI